jgi:hypothetical protein
MIKAVFFDLDGTLFNRDATIAAIVAWQVRAFSSVIPPARTAEFCSKVVTLDNHGQRDKRDVFATVGADLGLAPSVIEQLIATFSAEYPRHAALMTTSLTQWSLSANAARPSASSPTECQPCRTRPSTLSGCGALWMPSWSPRQKALESRMSASFIGQRRVSVYVPANAASLAIIQQLMPQARRRLDSSVYGNGRPIGHRLGMFRPSTESLRFSALYRRPRISVE